MMAFDRAMGEPSAASVSKHVQFVLCGCRPDSNPAPAVPYAPHDAIHYASLVSMHASCSPVPVQRQKPGQATAPPTIPRPPAHPSALPTSQAYRRSSGHRPCGTTLLTLAGQRALRWPGIPH